ncbi:MAG: hypothetical protein J7K87_02485 [Candidatus Aenigmarchaeota archaeon]|nr:hypothetical protein [Candidatus Aenigmarchaeota archaeon]
MKVIKKTDSKKKSVKKLYRFVDEVVERIYKKPRVKNVLFFFTEDPKRAFLNIIDAENVPHGRQYGKLEKWLSEDLSSFSVQNKKIAVIMINLNDPVLRNDKAAKALIAHEFSHTIEKSYGVEPKISRVGGKQWPFIIKTLQRIRKDYGTVLNDLIKLTTFFILCMKDIIVDEFLIESGFEEELEELRKYYKPKRIRKINKNNLADTIISYIGYRIEWIPFEVKLNRKIRYREFVPEMVEKECNKVVKQLKDIRPGKLTQKDIKEVVRTGLDAYRKLYKKMD